jgi:hypothetical protein
MGAQQTTAFWGAADQARMSEKGAKRKVAFRGLPTCVAHFAAQECIAALGRNPLVEIGRIEAGRFHESAPVLNGASRFAQGDQAFAAQFLDAAIDVHGREAGSVSDFALGERSFKAAATGKPDGFQPKI